MVLDNRLIGIRLNWEPTIRIAKIAIRFSTNSFVSGHVAALFPLSLCH